MIIYGK